LKPFFITGLTDAEGTFVTIVRKNINSRHGWRVDVVFQIGMHIRDLELLKLVQTYFGGIGSIVKPTQDMCTFRVSSPEQIFQKILPHFDQFPLITQKRADYLLFKEVVIMMLRKEHRELDGIQRIVNIRASLNLGLSEVLKAAFPNTIPFSRPIIETQIIPDPEWVAGFTSGEGCFFVKITKGRNKVGMGIQLVFQVAQHIRDEELIKSLVTYFGCGRYVVPSKKEWGYFQCTKFEDNYNIILEFFLKHPIRGIKAKDFDDWVKVAEIIKKEGHRTKEGSSEIIKIKAGMNTGRTLASDILTDPITETD